MIFRVFAYWLHFECGTSIRPYSTISQNHLYYFWFYIAALEVGLRSVQIITPGYYYVCGISSWYFSDSKFVNFFPHKRMKIVIFVTTIPPGTPEVLWLGSQPPFQIGWASSVLSALAYGIIAHFFYYTRIKVDFYPWTVFFRVNVMSLSTFNHSKNNLKNILEKSHPFSSLCMNFVAEIKLSVNHLWRGFADASVYWCWWLQQEEFQNLPQFLT